MESEPSNPSGGRILFNEEKIIAKWAADMYDANETDTADVDFALSIVGDAPKRIL